LGQDSTQNVETYLTQVTIYARAAVYQTALADDRGQAVDQLIAEIDTEGDSFDRVIGLWSETEWARFMLLMANRCFNYQPIWPEIDAAVLWSLRKLNLVLSENIVFAPNPTAALQAASWRPLHNKIAKAAAVGQNQEAVAAGLRLCEGYIQQGLGRRDSCEFALAARCILKTKTCNEFDPETRAPHDYMRFLVEDSYRLFRSPPPAVLEILRDLGMTAGGFSPLRGWICRHYSQK
jgi:hypothetical protein